MRSPHTPKQNHLLAALPADDYARLLPDLELTPMPLGWAVYESGGHLGYVYFPNTTSRRKARSGFSVNASSPPMPVLTAYALISPVIFEGVPCSFTWSSHRFARFLPVHRSHNPALSSAWPNLIHESLLCIHPHARAKTPTKQTYSEPLNNAAVIMMFLLPGNIYNPYSPEVMS